MIIGPASGTLSTISMKDVGAPWWNALRYVILGRITGIAPAFTKCFCSLHSLLTTLVFTLKLVSHFQTLPGNLTKPYHYQICISRYKEPSFRLMEPWGCRSRIALSLLTWAMVCCNCNDMRQYEMIYDNTHYVESLSVQCTVQYSLHVLFFWVWVWVIESQLQT